jgi:hypothetical protein
MLYNKLQEAHILNKGGMRMGKMETSQPWRSIYHHVSSVIEKVLSLSLVDSW